MAIQLFLFKQALSTPDCIDAAPPICAGDCLNGGSCVHNSDSQKCECLPVAHLPPAPCDKATLPECKGECLEAGKECFPPDPRNPNLGCECKTPCGDTTAPSCVGSCPYPNIQVCVAKEDGCECIPRQCGQRRAGSCSGGSCDYTSDPTDYCEQTVDSSGRALCACVTPTPEPCVEKAGGFSNICSGGSAKCPPGLVCSFLNGKCGCNVDCDDKLKVTSPTCQEGGCYYESQKCLNYYSFFYNEYGCLCTYPCHTVSYEDTTDKSCIGGCDNQSACVFIGNSCQCGIPCSADGEGCKGTCRFKNDKCEKVNGKCSCPVHLAPKDGKQEEE